MIDVAYLALRGPIRAPRLVNANQPGGRTGWLY